MRSVNLYFVDFEASPLVICRAVRLQPFSCLAKGVICPVLLSLVFQLVQKLCVCKWPCHFPAILLLPFKMVGQGGECMFDVFAFFFHFSLKLFVPKLYTVKL